MAAAESPRPNQAALTAVRAVLGCTEEVAADIVEIVRPHIEQPLRSALARALEENQRLRKDS